MAAKIQNYADDMEVVDLKSKLQNELNSELQSIKKRIVEIEEKANTSYDKDSKEYTDKAKKEKEEEDCLVTCEKIELDVYFFMPMIFRLFYKFFFTFLYYLLTIPFHLFQEDKQKRLKNFGLNFIGCILYLFISAKSYWTFITQIYLTTQLLHNISHNHNEKFLESKILISLILVAIVYKEVMQGFRNAMYSLYVIWNKFNISVEDSCLEKFLSNLFSIFLIFPGLGQIGVSIWIFYASILVIRGTETILDLIQNFAGLVVILEIDNYTWDVLVILRFHTLAIKALERVFYRIEEKSNEIIEYLSNMVNDEGVLLRPERDFSYWGEKFYYLAKILLILGLVIFAIVYVTNNN